jgi:probable F420-dependent oxidoreductase
MRFGLIYANAFFPTRDGAHAMATAAEEAGFDSLWAVEHVLMPAGYESRYPYSENGRMPGGAKAQIPDPLVWLTFAAAVTSRIGLATGVMVLPQRNPAVTAKEVATLDVLAGGGRVRLGVGAGWLAEEFAALGVPFEDRGKRLDAYVEAMRALWSGQEVDLENAYVRYERAVSLPSPPAGSIPIVIGGHTEVAARRAGRIGDGFFPAGGDLPALFDTMRRTADAAGRDPDAIEITTGDPAVLDPSTALEAVERFEELGVDRLLLPPPTFDPAAIGDALAELAERVGATSSS